MMYLILLYIIVFNLIVEIYCKSQSIEDTSIQHHILYNFSNSHSNTRPYLSPLKVKTRRATIGSVATCRLPNTFNLPLFVFNFDPMLGPNLLLQCPTSYELMLRTSLWMIYLYLSCELSV